MIAAVILFSFIIATALITRHLARTGLLHESISRKILHIIAVGISAFSVMVVHDNKILLWFASGSLPPIYFLVTRGFFWDNVQNRPSWGIFYFAVVYATLIFFFPNRPALVFYPLLVLALADGFAAITGYYFGKNTYKFGNAVKSWGGSASFFIFACLVLGLFPYFYSGFGWPVSPIYLVVIVCLFLTIIEALSVNGRDNLWVPVAVIYWMLLDSGSIPAFAYFSIPVMAVLAYLAFRRKWLTDSGALAASILGCLLILSPRPVTLLFPATFLVIGSLLSRLQQEKSDIDSSQRNANQVFCNGAVAVGFMAIYFLMENYTFLIAGIAGFAAALSDTASSEIGTRLKGKTVSIINFKKVQPGLSGGISISGTVAGAAFAALMAVMAATLFPLNKIAVFWAVLIAGFLGNVIDSLAGDVLQIKYFDENTSTWSDHPSDVNPQKYRGFPGVDNDVVNLISTSAACVTSIFVYNAL